MGSQVITQSTSPDRVDFGERVRTVIIYLFIYLFINLFIDLFIYISHKLIWCIYYFTVYGS